MNTTTIPETTTNPNDELRMAIRECKEAAIRIADALRPPARELHQEPPPVDPTTIATARTAAEAMVGAFEEMERGLIPLTVPGREYIRRELVDLAGTIFDRKVLDACHDHAEVMMRAGDIRELVLRLEALAEKIGT